MSRVKTGSDTRTSLILRIRNPRDEASWAEFVGVYGPLIFGMCQKVGLSESDAADTTQNVFVRVLRTIRSFDYQPEVGRFRGWLGTLTRSEIAETCKRLGRTWILRRDGTRLASSPHNWADGAWEEAYAACVYRVALSRTRARASKRSWIIFKLTWIVGCPAERVARRLKLPVARVFEIKSRTLKRFRDEVELLAEDAAALVPLEC